ncbi:MULTISPECIES: exonuclease domain-containing protein [Rhodococcus]|uniref:exonuclease domain-containing protein n=1 Tax=Rhodococcus TaxID=1827 RepID=UPI000A644101|nr:MULTISPECIES: exonuclease domain-containing protein [Rhodococcus]WAL49747.1 exonuclease domain-containing protein [Rhodococcus pyridinivorans]
MANRIITARTVRKPEGNVPGVLTLSPFVAIDVETSGVNSATDRVIEVAAVKMNHRGEVLDSFTSLMNPGYDVPLNPYTQRVHGISPNMVWSAPPTEQVLAALTKFVGSCGVVAHNLSFESRFLGAEYERLSAPAPSWQGICTLAAARAHLIAPNYKLETLLKLLDLPAVNSHRAHEDARACGLLMAAMIERAGVSDLVPLNAPTISPTRSAPTAAIDLTGRDETQVIDQNAVRTAMGGFDPTTEQTRILDAFNSGAELVICALAGTGKTSTLKGIARLEAQRHPRRHGLYLAFNRSVANEAKSQFPDQVQASTAHTLALRHLRSTAYGPLLAKLNGGRATFREIATAIDSRSIYFASRGDGPALLAQYPVTRLALATVERFCTTMDEQIGPEHVPAQAGIEDGTNHRAELVEHIVPLARRAWAAICSPHTWTIKFTPTHMLKLWADMHPTIGREGDYLMLDEAQDANPLIDSIVRDQTHLQRVRVGDQNQAIYGFTGAIDAMSNVAGATYLSLTQSWRFGAAVADVANIYLRKLGTTLRVVGNDRIDSRLITDADPVDAVLCRTNGAALRELMAAQHAGKKTALIGDTLAATRFCESAELLKAGQSPRDADLAAFTTWGELQDYVEHAPGASDLKTLVELVDTYGVDDVRSAMGAVVSPGRAEMIAATCHKTKGLEFDRVRISYDWEIEATQDEQPMDPETLRDEQMLAYVGLTRAKRHLDPGLLVTSRAVEQINAAHGHDPLIPGLTPPQDGMLL